MPTGTPGGPRRLVQPLGQVELGDRPPADDGGARQTQQLLRAGVPDADDAVPVGADDRLLGDRVDDTGHRPRAGVQHAGCDLELLSTGLHLGVQRGLLRLQPLDPRGLPGHRAAQFADDVRRVRALAHATSSRTCATTVATGKGLARTARSGRAERAVVSAAVPSATDAATLQPALQPALRTALR